MVANKGKDGNLEERSDSPRHEKWEIGSSRSIFWRWELIREQETESHLDQKGIVRDQMMQCQRDGWKRREHLSRSQLHVRPAGGDLNHTSPRPHQRAVDLECRWSRHPWGFFCLFFFTSIPGDSDMWWRLRTPAPEQSEAGGLLSKLDPEICVKKRLIYISSHERIQRIHQFRAPSAVKWVVLT